MSALTIPTSLDGPSPVATTLLDAIVQRDRSALTAILAPDVWLRAMVVRDVIERHGAGAAIEVFDGWFGQAHELQVLRVASYPVASREHITYRLRLRPGWAPDVWHLIEQSGYIRVHEGRVRRIDLGCTGFLPE